MITIERIANRPTYCIGRYYIDGKYICDTLEDTDRFLDDSMSLAEILRRKIPGKTAIPTGIYKLDLDTFSPKFGNDPFYRRVCGGRLPRLIGVKGYQGILFHCGNISLHTDGCLLVGENKVVGKVINSQKTFERLYPLIRGGKNTYVEVVRRY